MTTTGALLPRSCLCFVIAVAGCARYESRSGGTASVVSAEAIDSDATHSSRAPVRRPRMPGEFEPVDYLLLVWSDYLEDLTLDLATAAWGQADIIFLLGPDIFREEVEERLAHRDLDPNDVEFFFTMSDSPWVRDYGPLVIHNGDGSRGIVDADYYDGLEAEDSVPGLLAQLRWRSWPLVELPVAIEGGNLLSDGTGRCITTAGHSTDDIDRYVPADTLRRELAEKVGCERVIIVPPLAGEETEHVDMAVTITAPGEAIVGAYKRTEDAVNAGVLDEVAATLTAEGFSIRRIPMPHHRDGKFRSYTNALALNQVVLVPVYPEAPEPQDRALAVFQEAYPDRDIIPIAASKVIQLGGAVHCVTMTIARAEASWLALGK